MNSSPARVARAALAILLPLLAGRASADAEVRTSLLITYKCRPESRPAFRDHLQGPGLAQLGTWKAAGLFADHLLLFNVDVEQDAWDALLLLRFDSWAQYARWKENERTSPAGLTPAALKLTSSVSSALSEVAWHGARPPADVTKSPVFFVRPYFFQDRNLYTRFFEAYNDPQLKAWLRTGAVTSYRVLMNQNPTGGTWGAMFIYEYPDWDAAHARDDVKEAVGPELRSLPAWDLLGQTKGAIRTSGRVTLAERLGPPSSSR